MHSLFQNKSSNKKAKRKIRGAQLLILLTVISLGACDQKTSSGSSVDSVDDRPWISLTRPIFVNGIQHVNEGDDSFISATGVEGENARSFDAPEANVSAEDAEGAGGSEARSVEEGDIYRVVNEGLMANLNHYRGLQLVNIEDPTAPELLSRLSLSGSPVEMYFIQGYAVVLMNNWWGYWGVHEGIAGDPFNGGLVALIDIRDTSNPELVSIKPIPGYITTSRLTRGMGGDALFVVANNWNGSEETAILRSFSVETMGSVGLTLVGELDLGGYISDIQATPSTLLIARQQGWWSDQAWDGTYVTLVDISDPSGAVIEGGSVSVPGYVRKKSDMNIHNGVLRVVSIDWDEGSKITTWNIDDLQNPVSVDSATFGEGEDLYASLFLEDKAFFVTYQRVDPFHAFSIDSEGLIEERTEYIISGWNDFFRPTFDQSRLIGIGMDDQLEGQDGQSIAVSLYSTSLEDAEPFIARAHGDLNGWSWSEARWDDRAFSVIENAVSIAGPDGVTETGLVLLPFSGYDIDDQGRGRWKSGVQLFTFSEQSVTARGTMSHNSPVRRSFEATQGTVGNLSELSLSLYDRSNPDEPSLLGQLDLAPEISRVFFIGEGPARHPVRLHGSDDQFYWWYSDSNADMAPSQLEILAVGADVDLDQPIATIDIPARASVTQVGSTFHAVVDHQFWDEDFQDLQRDINLHVYDLSDPENPRQRGEINLNELVEGYDLFNVYRYDYWGCNMDSYWWGRPSLEIHPVRNGLAVKTLEAQREVLGQKESCFIRYEDVEGRITPRDENLISCDRVYDEIYTGYDENDQTVRVCQDNYGDAYCSRIDEADFECHGSINHCVYTFEGSVMTNEECETIEGINFLQEATRLSQNDQCNTYDIIREWGSARISFIDTQDLDRPQISSTLLAPPQENFQGLIVQDEELLYSYSVPVDVEGDRVSFVRHFTRSINHGNLSAPQFNSAVNLPGKLLLKRGDLIVSRDLIWSGDHTADTLNLTRLNAEGTRAQFITRQRFDGRKIQTLALDQTPSGEERIVVSHRFDYNSFWSLSDEEQEAVEEEARHARITIFGVEQLDQLGDAVSDRWATMLAVDKGKGFFRVGGGVLLMDLSNPSEITPQAFLPVMGWNPTLTIEGDHIYAASGRYGVFNLELESSNLLPPL